MIQSLLKGAAITRVVNATAAGVTNVNGTVLDMQGYDSVIFVAAIGTLTATQVTKLKAQAGAAANGSDAADITGSETAAMADGDGTKLLVSEVIRPQSRYVRCVVERATANAVIDGVIAVQFNASKKPVTQGTTVSQSVAVFN